MSWLKNVIPPKIKRIVGKVKKNIPEGLWHKCPACQTVLYKTDLEKNLEVCSNCGFHNRISGRDRIKILLDTPNQIEHGDEIKPIDHLRFNDTKPYKERLNSSQKELNENDALIVVEGKIESIPVVLAVFEFKFMGGSMGSVVGQKFVEGMNRALEKQLPFVCFSTSGGARMQESLVSLYQMAKTSAVIERMNQAGLPYISVMIDPIYGGVSASLAMLGDINIAEPKALVGFTGPRVIEQTLNVQLPEGFQRSEFLLEHGAIDMIVHRKDMRSTLHRLLTKLQDKAS